MNILKEYEGGGMYREIYHNPIDDLLYASNYNNKSIHILDLDLNLVDKIDLNTYMHVTFAIKNDVKYIGVYSPAQILVIESDGATRNYNIQCNGELFTSIFDEFGYFAISCEGEHTQTLFKTDGTNTGLKYISSSARYISIDQSGWIVSNNHEILIAYELI